jgi:phosphatidate cytidylyltransferase
MFKRLATSLLLLALIVPAVFMGGVVYFAYVSFFILVAAWEYSQMFTAAGHRPSVPITVGGTFLLLAVRALRPAWIETTFTILILITMTYYLVSYERRRNGAALEFVITLGGFTYLGWVAGYMLDLRALPEGAWWVLLVFPVVWVTDSGAYMIGSRYGEHKMLPRLSPNKSWEGFAAGVLIGTLYGGFFAFAYSRFGPLHVSIWQGVLLGFVLSTVTTLGDLSESLFKRFANVKDSGSFLPGHGGAFDRIDSLIWAAVIGVIWIRLFLL